MRFRLADSIYVYGIYVKPFFDTQQTWVGATGTGITRNGLDTIPVRNYGIEPRNLDYYDYDPIQKWYQTMVQRVLKTFPKNLRNVKYGYSWDILNYHAHTIQLAMRRYIAKK